MASNGPLVVALHESLLLLEDEGRAGAALEHIKAAVSCGCVIVCGPTAPSQVLVEMARAAKSKPVDEKSSKDTIALLLGGRTASLEDALSGVALLEAENCVVVVEARTHSSTHLPGSWLVGGEVEVDACLVAAAVHAQKVLLLVANVDQMLYDIMPPSMAGTGVAHVLLDLHFEEARQLCSAAEPAPFNPKAIELAESSNITLVIQFVSEDMNSELCAGSEALASTAACTRIAGRPTGQLSISSALEPQVKAVSAREHVTLVSVESFYMWRAPGFLAKVFTSFEELGLSVDLVTTSPTNVTASLESRPSDGELVLLRERLVAVLAELVPGKGSAEVSVVKDCVAISLVGRQIRRILSLIEPTLRLFQEHNVHMISQAATDLTFTLVVDPYIAKKVAKTLVSSLVVPVQEAASRRALLAGTLISQEATSGVLQPSSSSDAFSDTWWFQRKGELLELAQKSSPAYVYCETEVSKSVDALQAVTAIDGLFFAMKANPHESILRFLHGRGINFECVSPGEVQRILELFPDIDRKRILFTPNFAPRSEYEYGFAEGIHVTVDNIFPLQHWGETFRGREVKLRVDPGKGKGHHAHVRTAGKMSKFGITTDDLATAAKLAQAIDCKVVGLHCHVGSGILEPDIWGETASLLSSFKAIFKDLEVVDVGGGLGVVENETAQVPLQLQHVNEQLMAIKESIPGLKLWMEPGRYFVAKAGVLLAKVTQLKSKGGVHYVGIDTGFNSLIRPALYGSHHHIFNLTRLDAQQVMIAEIVGQICETGDVLGHQREIAADTAEGDVVLVATAGAYGHSMSMNYNLREPAEEHYLH